MGTWSLIVVLLISSTASLEKKCPSNILKKFLSDSSKAKEHYQNGETISVTCLADSGDSGYDYDNYDDNAGSDTKDSSVVLTCTEGKWIGRYPECFTNCSKPDIHAILDPEYDLYAPGDNVTITACKKGNARIEGDTTLICMADGTWTGSARCPKEQRSCNEQPPTITNAYIAARLLDEYRHGTILRYKCLQAYDQMGIHSVTCQDGRWIPDSASLMRCIIGQCSPIYNREIDNGRVKNIVGEVGTYAEFECYDGYELDGNERILCMADRKWYPEIPKCKPVSCPSPKQPLYGRVVQEAYNGVLNIYQSTIRYDCDKGYRMVGPQFRKCQADSTWSGNDTKCEEILCDQPSPPEYGKVYLTDNSEKVGSQIEYICDEHHIMEPITSQFAICTEHGHWSKPKPRCIKTCDVRVLSHGSIKMIGRWGRKITENTHVPDNNELIFTCDNGYERYAGSYKTDGRLNCLNGTLLPGPHECRPRRCLIEPTVDLVYFIGRDKVLDNYIHSGTLMQAICPHGMVLVSSSAYLDTEHVSVKCKLGTLEPGSLDCKDKRCNITKIENGHFKHRGNVIVVGEKIESGRNIRLECTNGYELYDESSYKFLELEATDIECYQGSFTAEIPSCKPKRCILPAIENGLFRNGMIEIDPGKTIRSSSNINVTCADGYELYNEISNVYIELQSTVAICYQGSFNPEIPTCKPKRCILPELENGLFRNGMIEINPGETIRSSSNISVTCAEGYELHNAITNIYLELQGTGVICYQGSFNPEIPTCKPRRCLIELPVNLEYFIGAMKVKRYVDNGTVMEARCPDRMELFRSGEYLNRREASVICNMGTLDPGPLDCKEKMCKAPNLVGKITGYTVSGTEVISGAFVLHNKSIVAVCSEGYRQQGALTCNAGTWTGNSSCELEFCDKPTFLYTIVSSFILVKDDREFLHRTKLNASCEPSSALHNDDGKMIQSVTATTECIHGEWKPNFTCKKMCKPPFLTSAITGFTVNGTKTKPEEFFPHDQSIEAVCSEGYRQQGTLTCNAGIWTGNSTCELEVCNEPAFQYTIVKNGTLVNEDIIFSHGTKLNASCESSFTLMIDDDRRGNGTTECMHGEWKPKFSCKKKCTLPAGTFKFVHNMFESRKEGDQIRHGRKMQSDCQSRNKTLLPSICTNGTWVPLFQGCAKDIPRCRIPNDPGMNFTFLHNGTVIADGYVNAGDMVLVSCKFGYKTFSSPVTESAYEYDYFEKESTADHAREPKSMASEKPKPASDGNYTCDESGNWEPEIRLTCKQIICDGLDDYNFENGRIIYSTPYVKTEGTVASFTCHPGYRRVGNENRTCQEDGTWSGECVTCQNYKHNSSTCPAPCIPDGARKTGSHTYEKGSKVEFHCLPSNTQYSGDSSNIRHCIDGNNSVTWNGTEINCKGIRDVLLIEIAESFSDEWRNLSLALGLRSDEIIVTANEPAMNASLKILQYWRDNAMRGKPRSLIPQLIIALEKLQKRQAAEVLRIVNGLHRVQCMRPVLNGTFKPMKSYYQFGESVTVSSCNDGYMLENEGDLVCSENETWLGNSTCRYAICSPPCSQNKRCVRDNECQCAEGFFGKACVPEILAEGECGALVDHYRVIKTSVLLGRRSYTVGIQCNASQAPFDDISEAECKDGKWYPWKPICENRCTLSPVLGTRYNYNISKDPVLPGLISSNRKIKVTCESGYILRLGSSDVSQCENGIWKPDISACEKIVSCTTPNISDVKFQPSKERYAVNETVSLTGCQKGLELEGAKILSCGRDGSWSGHAQCLSYCKNRVADWKERRFIQYNGNVLLDLGWLQNRSKCLQNCEAQAECRAVHVIHKTGHFYCKLLRGNTKSNHMELYSHIEGVIIERVCIDACEVPKALKTISLHNGDSPYYGEGVEDGMVLSIKCKISGLTAVPGSVTCMGGKWNHPIEKISCLYKPTNV